MKITRLVIVWITLILILIAPDIQAQETTSITSIPNENPPEISTPRDIDSLFTRAVYCFQTQRALDLLDGGANIEFRGWFHGYTPLLFVSQYNQLDSLFYALLQRGADPFVCDSSGATTLHLAAKLGNVNKISTLIECGVDPDVRNYALQTPLHLAAAFNNLEAVAYLIQMGANIEAKDSANHTPLWNAWQSTPPHPVYFEGPDYYDREGMRQWGAPESFETLINANADISAISWKGVEPILRLAEYDNPALLKLALSNVAILNDTSASTTPKHIAARFNCIKNTEFLLSKGLSPDITDDVGDTPLIVACRQGSFDVVKALIKAGADVNYLPPPTPRPEWHIVGHRAISQFRPLFWAMNANHPDIVIYLLQNGADPDHVDNRSDPILLTAVTRQDTFLVNELISYSVNPNIQNSSGYSPIEYALLLNNLGIAKILHQAGASFDFHTTRQFGRDSFTGYPFLHRMAAQQNEEATLWLLESNANPNELDGAGQTAAFHAAYYNQVKILEHLVEFGIDLNTVNRNGETALHTAARQGSEEAMKYLLHLNVDPNTVSKEGFPPLGDLCRYRPEAKDSISLAVWGKKSARMANDLINAGASIEIMCRGRTLLDWAFENKNKPLAEVALENGADPIMIDKHKLTLLHRLGWPHGKGWMVSLLIRYGADPNAIDEAGDTPILRAANQQRDRTPDSTYFEALLKGGANINYQNPKGLTALSGAIEWTNAELTHWLLQNGASPDLIAGNGFYPLYRTVKMRDVPCAELLLEAGASADKAFPKYNNATYLHFAAKYSYFDILHLLLKHGADPNKRDDNGDTPLHFAASSKHPNEGGWCVEALLQAGADVNARNNAGLTPLDVAEKSGCEHIQELLTSVAKKQD
jgi:ankyrin repeat protein